MAGGMPTPRSLPKLGLHLDLDLQSQVDQRPDRNQRGCRADVAENLPVGRRHQRGISVSVTYVTSGPHRPSRYPLPSALPVIARADAACSPASQPSTRRAGRRPQDVDAVTDPDRAAVAVHVFEGIAGRDVLTHRAQS